MIDVSCHIDRAADLIRTGVPLADMPADLRETALDLLAIKHGPAVRAMVRDQAIDAASNVIRLADARAKLPKDGA